jgi:hypothetical protein
MGLLSELGLQAAGTMRARLGARGALSMLSPMIASSPPSAARAAAIEVALECAIEVSDDRALQRLAAAWEHELEPKSGGAIGRLVAERLASGDPARALTLASAEIARRDGAGARRLRAVTNEARGAIDHAIDDWRGALDRADGEQEATAIRIELARVLSLRSGGRIEAARIVAGVADEGLDERGRLIVAIARLGESGRYARVRGLDALIELARTGAPPISRAAIRAAASHADEGAATEIELERVGAVLAVIADPVERARALEVLAALVRASSGDPAERSAALVRAASVDERTRGELARARSILSGDAPGPRDGSTWPAFAAIAAIRRHRDDDALERLRELRKSEGSAPVFTAAWMALERDALRSEGLAVIGALLDGRRSPPRGFLDLASRLERVGDGRLALRALARAHEHREPGARERRVAALVIAGWEAARRGERAVAIALLGDAERLA